MKSSIWLVIIAILWFGGWSYALLFQTERIMNIESGKWKNHSATFHKFFGFAFLFATILLIWVFFKRLSE